MLFQKMTELYSYEKLKETECKGTPEKWIQYRIDAQDLLSGKRISYLLDFMKVGALWITEIYPEMWVDASDRCRRLTSHEDIRINFERLSNTSVKVFLSDFPADGSVMVISGSYQEEEDKSRESRRLRMYRYFFNRLRSRLQFDVWEVAGGNAFFISHPDSNIELVPLITQYRDFKNSR